MAAGPQATMTLAPQDSLRLGRCAAKRGANRLLSLAGLDARSASVPAARGSGSVVSPSLSLFPLLPRPPPPPQLMARHGMASNGGGAGAEGSAMA